MKETEETWIRFLGREDPLEEGVVTQSSILAWRITWTDEPRGLQSMGLQSWTRLKRLSSGILVSTVAVPFPPAMHKGSSFPTSPSTLVIFFACGCVFF